MAAERDASTPAFPPSTHPSSGRTYSHFAERADRAKAESLMQRRRSRIRWNVSRNDAMNILPAIAVEQRSVEFAAEALTDGFGRAVDAGLHRRVVGRLGTPAHGACISRESRRLLRRPAADAVPFRQTDRNHSRRWAAVLGSRSNVAGEVNDRSGYRFRSDEADRRGERLA